MAIVPINKIDKHNIEIIKTATAQEIETNRLIFNRHQKKSKKKVPSNPKQNTTFFVPTVILKHRINGKHYLVLNRKSNIIEVVNINNMSDSYLYQLSKKDCTFENCGIISKEEYDIYIDKLHEFKNLAAALIKTI